MDINKELTELKAKVTPINTAKFLAGALISVGAATAVTSLLKCHAGDSKGLMKLIVKLGIFVLGCKAGDIAEDYFSETLDKLIESFKEAQEETKDESDANQ